MASERQIERLCRYRRILLPLARQGAQRIFSHDLAAAGGLTAAQVRRDMMDLGVTGSPAKGYEIKTLVSGISEAMDSQVPKTVALVGIGQIGRAVLGYFTGWRPDLSIVAAFDSDTEKQDRVIHGCRCYSLDRIEEVFPNRDLAVGIVAVPAVAAQEVADRLMRAGAKGLLNFAPADLQVPADVYVETIDISVALEKVAYFATRGSIGKEILS